MTTIPAYRLAYLEEKVAKLNRKAVKLGMEPMTITAGPTYTDIRGLYDSRGKRRSSKKLPAPSLEVEVHGQPPLIEGWAVVARIDYLDGENALLQVAPNESIPNAWATERPVCDHCGINHYRKRVVVVRNVETNELLRLGTNCTANYIPRPEFAQYLEMLASIERYVTGELSDDEWGYANDVPAVSLVEYLVSTLVAIKHTGGYVSRSAAYEGHGLVPTTYYADIHSGLSRVAASDKSGQEDKAAMKAIEVTDEMRAEAQAVLEWAVAIDAGTDNNYLQNLVTIARMGTVTHKLNGYASSMVTAYRREMGRIEARKVRESAHAQSCTRSNHVGEVKQRLEMTVTVESIFSKDGYYGVTHIHRMLDQEGNRIIWFCTGAALDEGSTVKVKATVKEHGEFRGEKQTIVQRVTVA